MTERSTLQPPVLPTEPEPWECCGSGCESCVYDRYWEELERYEQAFEQWCRRTGASADVSTSRPRGGSGD